MFAGKLVRNWATFLFFHRAAVGGKQSLCLCQLRHASGRDDHFPLFWQPSFASVTAVPLHTFHPLPFMLRAGGDGRPSLPAPSLLHSPLYTAT
ncbi:MAG: hypothetical protein IAE79_17035 [Anaerolinea sp.]|nr:hypothetical protein [Anaerolinea sp.]